MLHLFCPWHLWRCFMVMILDEPFIQWKILLKKADGMLWSSGRALGGLSPCLLAHSAFSNGLFATLFLVILVDPWGGFSCYFSPVLCGTHILLILSNLLVIFLGLLVLPLFSVQFLFLLLDNIIKLWRADGAFPNLLVKRCNLWFK